MTDFREMDKHPQERRSAANTENQFGGNPENQPANKAAVMPPPQYNNGNNVTPAVASGETEAETAPETEGLVMTSGELTTLGEGNDEQTKYIHWPDTESSGVTLGKGYDIGNRTAGTVIEELMAAGMSEDQATKISLGAGLTGSDADTFVNNNKYDIGEIAIAVQRSLLATMLVEYTDRARTMATSTTATQDTNGNYTNARGREIKDGVDAGTYVMSDAQWDALHPAMIEFVTDLKYQGGYYAYGRVAQVNKVLIENHGDQLEQFKAVAELFQSDDGLSYMDRYGSAIGEGTGNTTNFYGQSSEDLEGASTRRNRIRLGFLLKVIAALEAGETVTMSTESTSTDTATTTGEETTTTTAAPSLGDSEAASDAAATVADQQQTTYVVLPGEGLGVLAQKHNTTIEALRQANADKLKRWGNVEGFNAGETIVIPQATSTTAVTVEETASVEVEDTLDYNSLAQDVYNAMFAVFYGTGLGTDEQAVYGALIQLENNEDYIQKFKTAYTAMFGRDVVADIKSDFTDVIFGDHSAQALGYLNATASPDSSSTTAEQTNVDSPAPTTEVEAASPGGEQVVSETGTPVTYTSGVTVGSVGAGGTNTVSDVKMIQTNLIHLGYLANGAEVSLVAGMEDTATVEDSQLEGTIAAIKLFQKTGLSQGNGDGRVDAGGATFTAMSTRLAQMQELSTHEVEAEPIDLVMETSDWISQFKTGANIKNDGTSVNMTITGDGRGLLDSEKAYATKSNFVCCWDAAKAMVESQGGSINSVKSSFLQTMVQDGGEDHHLGDQAKMGVNYVDSELLAGNPVFLAVDDGRTEVYNYDKTTEHYIVIVGKVIKDGKIYYRFFDPGTAHGATKGHVDTNLLLVGDDYSLTGSKPGSSRTYTGSHIRQNT